MGRTACPAVARRLVESVRPGFGGLLAGLFVSGSLATGGNSNGGSDSGCAVGCWRGRGRHGLWLGRHDDRLRQRLDRRLAGWELRRADRAADFRGRIGFSRNH